MLRINQQIAIPLAEFHWEASRAGGPGGQNVNKVNSKVTLRWTPASSPSLPAGVRNRLLEAVGPRLTREGELLITSQASRDQSRNLADCLAKLRALVLDAAIPPKVRRPTRPTLASRARRLDSKSRNAAAKRLRRTPDSE